MQDTARAARRVCNGAQKARERAAREHAVQIANMPPKAPVPKVAVPSEEELARQAENEAIREAFDRYLSACRRATDSRKEAPELSPFARSASDDQRVSKTFDSVYMSFKRARENGTKDPISTRGRPGKGLDSLQKHAFARTASANATLSKGCLGKTSLAVFDSFAASDKDTPRAITLSGSKLNALIDDLQRQEPWLTTTQANLTSADRLDGTAVNIMDAYYQRIDDLALQFPVFDLEPSRIMNFDECGLNNRGGKMKLKVPCAALPCVD